MNWSLEDFVQYRDKQIHEIITYSASHVPYYRAVFRELGIEAGDINSLNDLSKLPIIDKKTVREHYEEFLSDEFAHSRLNTTHTSGTTGAGLILKAAQEFDDHNWAIAWVEHNKIGIEREMWCGYFAGRPIVPAKQKKQPYFRINKPGRQIMFSSFHMNDETLYSYVDILNKYQPPWIHGYPSAVSLLADFMNRTGYRINYSLKVITLSSENVMAQQCQEIKDAFGIFPHQTYGQTEGVAYFRDYEPGEIYVVENCAAVEFVLMNDGISHIVGTNFNKAMPLIRYDTHDIAECEETDRGRRVLSIDGRAEDYITTKDGSKIGRLDHIFKDAENVIEAQIVQTKDGNVTFKIKKSDKYTSKDEKMIRDLIDERLGGRIHYHLTYVNSINRTGNGKLRFVVSEFDPELRGGG